MINNYVKPLYMLGTSNILNTRNNKYFSENFKDITMSNQQVNKFILFIKEITLFIYFIFYNLRDYTRGIFQSERLRYSPIFYKSTRRSFNNAVPVNKVFKRNYSIDNRLHKLDPNWVTGFVDAEGCFSTIIEVSEDLKRKVRVSFEINLHEKDEQILVSIKSFFGVGQVYNRSDKKISMYRVTNVNYIKDNIIPHFIEYPLMSKKALDFLLWSKVIEIILNKEHLSEEGFLKVLSYYAYINTGVSKKVQKYYPNIIPADKPDTFLPETLHPQWVSGFVAGDGGFSIYIRSAKDYVISEKVSCRFHIAQHIRDLELMKLFIKFFDCGSVGVRSNKATPRCDFYVQDFFLIVEKILPHFDTYPLLNLKQQDYLCFKECVSIIKSKTHLTREGLNKIKSLNLEMNSNRLK
uniref:LAGLIDADG endonuclease n=1 Tax=Fusarium brasilicum TaxID=281087 RepID=UPI002028AE22|nr:LAGLIDADG endonuclease [Fusarium brasilicum]UPX01629.1 LAGLIDADG endonuclease [Fusarium brasilicum]UPX01681.1 LAGLIDADG endonuclease [Fusarium brasilicum]UPX01835.1 LAGLIDADG endonuclease [Fusarium cortaderiae]